MVTHIRSVDIGEYLNNYEDFNKNFSYRMCINRGRMTTTQCIGASLK